MSINHNQKYLVSPKPPIVHDELAHIGAGLRFAQSPTKFLAGLRREYGDQAPPVVVLSEAAELPEPPEGVEAILGTASVAPIVAAVLRILDPAGEA